MIKKTLYFGNPTYLSMRNNQLVVKLPEVEKNDTLPQKFKKDSEATFPLLRIWETLSSIIDKSP